MTPGELVLGLVIGLIAGVISATLGVGGGSVMVPAMVVFLGVDQATAQGTSLLVILPTAVAGVLAHLRRGSVRLSPTWVVGASGVLAALAGAYVALHINEGQLRLLFALFLIILGLREIFWSGGKSKDS